MIETNIRKVHFFSDNCASQFRSKWSVGNLCFLADDLDVEKVTWDTFAAGHGKGAVDALGGTIKRLVWLTVKARQVKINNAEDYYNFAATKADKVHVLYVSASDVQGSNEMLKERWKNVQDLKGLNSFHHFEKSDEKSITAAETVKSSNKVFKMFKPPKERLLYSDVYSESDSDSDSDSESEIDEDPIVCVHRDNLFKGVFVKIRQSENNEETNY